MTITVTEVVCIQVFFLTVGSKKKKEMNAVNTKPSLYHSKTVSQNVGVPFFIFLSFFWWGRVTVFSAISLEI